VPSKICILELNLLLGKYALRSHVRMDILYSFIASNKLPLSSPLEKVCWYVIELPEAEDCKIEMDAKLKLEVYQ